MRNLTKQEVIKVLDHSSWDWSNPHGESKGQIYRTIKGLWAELALEYALRWTGINPRMIEYNIPVDGQNRDIDARIFKRETIDAKGCNPYLSTNYLKPNNRKYFDWYFFYNFTFTCQYDKENLSIDNCDELLKYSNIKETQAKFNWKFLHFDNVKPKFNPIHGDIIESDFKNIKEFTKVVCSLQ